MKKNFEMPELEMTQFEVEDVMTTSGGPPVLHEDEWE